MTGKRAWITALGTDPLGAFEQHLALVDQERPTPEAPDDVVVEVHAAQVGWVDLLMASGQYQHVPSPPYTPGMEWAGEVVAIGPAVSRWKVGDRVLADGFRTGPRSSGRHQRDGGFATWAVAEEGALLPLPPALSYDEGACLLGSYETAWHALVHRARLQPGETALILGATGATGIAAVHVAKRMGATVIAISRSLEKLAIVASEGADQVWAGRPPELAAAIKAMTGGRGADVVYDGVGGDLSEPALRGASFGARYCVAGWASTPGAVRRDAPNVLPSHLVLMKGLSVLGCPAVIAAERDPQIRTERLAEIFRWVDEGLRPRVGQVWPLSLVWDALRAKRQSAFVGGGVLRTSTRA